MKKFQSWLLIESIKRKQQAQLFVIEQRNAQLKMEENCKMQIELQLKTPA